MKHEKLTQEDINKIEEEINYRKDVVRKKALEDVKSAREYGDLSENFEYKAAKQYKNQNESRIRYLERMLKNSELIEDHTNDDEVGLNTNVTVLIDDCEEETYKIVTSIRGNSLEGRISIDSPLGKALLGHKIGDRVYIDVNGKMGYDVVIKKIEKSQEDDEIRKY